jgi:hypothetical protein
MAENTRALLPCDLLGASRRQRLNTLAILPRPRRVAWKSLTATSLGTGEICNTKGLHDMNDNLDIFDLFREVFSVKTTEIADLMPTKAEQLEEILK